MCRDVLDRPDLLDRPEFTGRSRPEHVDALAAEIEPVLARRGTAHWVEALDRAGVPGGHAEREIDSMVARGIVEEPSGRGPAP